MEVAEYYRSLLSQIQSLADVEGELLESQFLNLTLEMLVDAGDVEDFDLIEDGRDVNGRWRIDAFHLNEEAMIANLFICGFTNELSPSNLTKTEITALAKKLTGFAGLVQNEDKDLYSVLVPTGQAFNAASALRSRWADVRAIRLFIISNKPLSNRVDAVQISDLAGKSTTLTIWDLKRFFELEQSGKEREEMEVDFSDCPVPCLVTSESDESFISLLAVMTGETLFRIYDRWGARLLEQNVRSYLQNRSKVNKGIRESIKKEPERFFAYNNGLTTTAEDVEFVDDSRTSIKSLKNLQIVNGGQTTSSIYAAVVKDRLSVADVSVQMKLTVVAPEKVQELVPYISRYANSQNKVSDADLFSNHPFHVFFEEVSRRTLTGPKAGSAVTTYWYYERARGQYLNDQAYLKDSARKAFQKQNPRKQLLSKTDLARFENAWRMLPASVSKGAQANFNEFAKFIDQRWNKSRASFNDDYFKSCIVHAIVYKKAEECVQKAPWYSGFRANVVAYTISLLSSALESSKLKLNYDHIFRTQDAPQPLVDLILEIAELVSSKLVNHPGNPTTYAKGSQAWSDMMPSLQPSPERLSELEDFLWDINEFEAHHNQAQKEGRIDWRLRAEAKVLSISTNQWEEIKEFLFDHDDITPMKLSLIDSIIAGQVPSERQSTALQRIVKEFEDVRGPIIDPDEMSQ